MLKVTGYLPPAETPNLQPAEPEEIARPVSPDPKHVSLSIVGRDWQGQILAKVDYQHLELDDPLPNDILDYWTACCRWYQLLSGEATLQKLKDRHSKMIELRKSLLRKAQTSGVKAQLQQLDSSRTLLEQEIKFLQSGFKEHGVVFNSAGKELDPELPLRESITIKSKFVPVEISAHAARIGMGPCVLLRVMCQGRSDQKKLDEFEATLPCRYVGNNGGEKSTKAYGWPTPDYDNITFKDVANALTKIYLSRNQDLEPAGPVDLLYCYKPLEPEGKAEDVFVHYTGMKNELYRERVQLVMDVQPRTVRVITPEETVTSSVDDVLKKVVVDVATGFD